MRFRYAVLAALATVSTVAQQPNPAKELETRVKAYLDLRKKAVEDVPKLKKKSEPEEILASSRAQADAIRAARSGAQRGDVLVPPVEAYLKEIVRSEMAGKSGKPVKDSAKQGNPAVEGVPVPLKVNAAYPESAPLSTFPPSLLLRLPKLPEEVSFRFVGRHLILLDMKAGIIVDFVPNAMPQE
jgi:hypothetical protein